MEKQEKPSAGAEEEVPTKVIPAAKKRELKVEVGEKRDESPPHHKSPKERLKITANLRKLARISADTDKERNNDMLEAEVFCVRFSPDSKYIAAGCGDGSVRIFNPEGKLSYLLNAGSADELPTTAIRFRPSSSTSRTKNMLICGNANGTIETWHMTSRKRIFKIEEEGNQVYALDYSSDGDKFASAGKDTVVRVYEEATKSLLATFERGFTSTNAASGHSNRVYALKFHPKEKNILMSAGWDNTVQIWDVRTKKSVRYIYGPHICGDALDVFEDRILTGSWKSNDALQLWDFKSGKLIQSVPFRPPAEDKADAIPEMLYAAAFSPDGKYIAAGGSGGSEARMFDVAEKMKLVDEFDGGGKGVYSLHFSGNGRKLATGSGNDQIAVMDL
mmetsp:Transcript_6903/g.8417  ORF Transcript_6903/g.8417 Transcript_6903/m.8417 type:complete len:389 (+) Transcript_6903:75-1241(+)|eukprot:jgi/Bigna1/88008/estExt_fgenesh1_pg.C_270042